jgi:hypothetical protein
MVSVTVDCPGDQLSLDKSAIRKKEVQVIAVDWPNARYYCPDCNYHEGRKTKSNIDTLVDLEVDKTLKGKLCTICNKPFLDRDEKDNAVCSGINPFACAHKKCWEKEQNDI